MSILSRITREAKPLPPRIVLYAAEKFGKTSWAAHSWNPIFLMSPGETGLLSLLEAGRVPPVDHFPTDFQDWWALQEAVKALRDDEHSFRTLVLDTGNGAELLCAKAVCEEAFRGDWEAYTDYGKGNERATKVWAEFLKLLDEVRVKRRMAIIILQHAKVKSFQDPAGKDWDQWRPEAVEKLWALTHKWADCILFGGFKTQVKADKAIGESRYIRAEACGPIVAGNRYGLPAELTAAPGADKLWKAFADALAAAKSRGAKATEAKPAAAASPPVSPPPVAPPPPPAPVDHSSPDDEPGPDDFDGGPDPEIDDRDAEGRGAKAIADAKPAANEPKLGGELTTRILDIGHDCGLPWKSADGKPSIMTEYAAAVGFVPHPDLKLGQLTAASGLSLLHLLQERLARKKEAAAKRATSKAGAA